MSDGEACRQRPVDRGVECPGCGGHLFIDRHRGAAEWVCRRCDLRFDGGGDQ
jgi:hypothetical protein